MATSNGYWLAKPDVDDGGFWSYLGPILSGIGGVISAGQAGQTPVVWGQAGSTSGANNGPLTQYPANTTGTVASAGIGVSTIAIVGAVVIAALLLKD